MTHQFDVLAVQKGAALRRCERPRFVFRISPKTLGKQIVLYHSEFKWNSRHMTSFAEETGEHLHRSASFTNNFR